MKAFKVAALIALAGLGLMLAGCSWTDKGGTHHLIVGIGFGVITTTNRAGVEVSDSRVLGGEFGPDGVGLGWLGHHRTAIDPAMASNVVISVKASGMSVTIKNFDPYGTNASGSEITTNQTTNRKTNQ